MVLNVVRRSRASGLRLAGLALALCACSKGHDLDALGALGSPSGEAAGIGGAGAGSTRISTGASGSLGSAGASGLGAIGIGGTGASAGRGGLAGRGGTAGVGRGGAAGRGGVTAGTNGGQPAGGASQNVSACMPCQDAMGLTGTLAACCTTTGTCGVDFSAFSGQAGCVQQNAPGGQTMACPSTSLMGFVTIPGCCGADGVCGLVIQQLAPLGCAHASDLGSLVTVPGPAMRCVPGQ
jgi:hypothetical protein